MLHQLTPHEIKYGTLKLRKSERHLCPVKHKTRVPVLLDGVPTLLAYDSYFRFRGLRRWYLKHGIMAGDSVTIDLEHDAIRLTVSTQSATRLPVGRGVE